MLKISVVEGPHCRRIIVEGALAAPWADELATACDKARTNLHGRELIVDLRGLTAISPEGEAVVLHLMDDKFKFQGGVFIREVLKQLARKRQRRPHKAGDAVDDMDSDC
jgi:hypothetical protein